MCWACGAYGWGEGVYRVLVGKPEGKRPLGRPRRRWVNNIRLHLQDVGCGYMDWIGLTQDRDRWRTLVSAVMNLRVPWNAGNFFTSCKPVSFSRRTLHHGVSKYYTDSNYTDENWPPMGTLWSEKPRFHTRSLAKTLKIFCCRIIYWHFSRREDNVRNIPNV